MIILLRAFTLLLPWPLRRSAMRWWFGYDLHPTSRIGWSWVFPRRLVMGAHASIGHLTVCKDLDSLVMGDHAIIGRLNWITGFPKDGPGHFVAQPDRRPELMIGEHASITNRHIIDCTDRVEIGRFTTVAGFRTQVLTHSIDLAACRQAASPVTIGTYCFIGTDAVILGGSSLPDYSVLGAKSLLNQRLELTHRLYAGVPAREVKVIDRSSLYFTRSEGFVH